MKYLLEHKELLILEKLKFNLRELKSLAIGAKELTNSIELISNFYVVNPKLSYAIGLASAIKNSWFAWQINNLDKKMIEQVKSTQEGQDLFKNNTKLSKLYKRNIDKLNKLFDMVVAELEYDDIEFNSFVSYLFSNKNVFFKRKKYKKIEEYITSMDTNIIKNTEDTLSEIGKFAKKVEDLYFNLEILGKL